MSRGIGIAGVKHPSNMTRKDKLAMIGALAKTEGRDVALRFWLRECPRLSRKAFEEAI